MPVSPQSRLSSGFTLTELMIVIALAGILFAVAIPSFLVSLTNSALTSESSRFLGALITARSEAITRGVSVTVCRSNNQTTCTTTGAGWSSGWIVFVDNNGNGSVDVGDQVLRADNALKNNITLTVADTGLQNFVRYLPSGNARDSGNSAPNGTFLLCRINRPPSLTDQNIFARSLPLNFVGRAAVVRGISGTGNSCLP